MPTHRNRSTAIGSLAIAALMTSAVPVAAQEDALANLSPEDQERAKAFVEFVENAGEWLQTVNQIDPASLPVTIPFEERMEHASIEVSYGDGEPLQFLVDTGAATLVTPEVAETYGGEVLVETLNVGGGDTVFFTPLQEYPTMTVGDLRIETPTGQTPWDAGGEFDCFARDGLFGANAMANAVWQIDYGTQEISVAASVDGLDHIESAMAVPFTPGGGLSPTPHVQLGVGDGVVDFIVDTGGGVPITIGTGDLASLGVETSEDPPTVNAIGFGAAGPFEAQGTFDMLPITFGETELMVPVSIADGLSPGAGGNIGHRFLKNFVVTFDWSTNTMYLDPLSDDGIPPFEDPAAATVGWNDGLIVSALPVGSPAAEAGLTLGETVTAIDDEPVGDYTLEDYCAFKTSGEKPQTITTETGTYDASPMVGFFGSTEE